MSVLSSLGVDLYLDIGAAEGQTGRALRRWGYTGRIVSFEPRGSAYEVLARAASKDEAWDAFHIGIGATDGTAEIHLAESGDSSSLLEVLPSSTSAASHTRSTGTEAIEIRRLDSVLPEIRGRAEMVFAKIDVQGFEREVLGGAGRSLDELTGVMLELSLVELYSGSMLFADAHSLMQAAGFVLRGVEPGFLDPRTGRMLQVDGLFLRDEHHGSLRWN